MSESQQEPVQQQLSSNIFELLPNDLIGEILGHINSVELIFSYSRVCKYWRSVCLNLIWQDYEKTISKFNLISHDDNDHQLLLSEEDGSTRAEYLHTFFTQSRPGRKFIKYLLRKHVYEFSCKLATISTRSDDQKSIGVNGKWVDTEISILKGYFNNFCDLSELPAIPLPKPTPQPAKQSQQEGFFTSTFSFIGSLFSKNQNSTVSSSTVVSAEKKPPEFNYLTKVLLDGYCGAGKTSILNCAMNDIPSTNPDSYIATIGADFAMKTFVFSETTRVKLQLWDQSGPEKYKSLSSAYYRGASVVLLLLDPYVSTTQNSRDLQMKKRDILQYSPKAEVIFITTKKDTMIMDLEPKQKRSINNDEADVFAFENFGGLHLDITNTRVDEPKCIIWYCALMKYLTSPPSHN